MASEYKWAVIGRGWNGWHTVARRAGASTSGCTLENYLTEAEEGAFVYDASEADKSLFMNFVINGPMLSLRLDPDEIRPFHKQPHGFATDAIIESFGMAQLAALGGLDEIGLNVYKRMLGAIPGVKLGTVQGGQVVWDV